MSPLTHIDEPDALVLDAMAAFIERAVAGFKDYSEDTRWQIQADSPCRRDEAALAHKTGPGGDWTGDELKHASSASWIFIVVAANHLSGMTSLLRSREVAFPLAPLVRSIQELTAQVAWLLDTRIDTRPRAARVMLSRIVDATRAKTTAYALGHPEASLWGQRLHEIRGKELPALFYPSEIVTRPNGRLVIADQQIPTMRQLQTFPEGVAGAVYGAEGLYDFLSDATHPTLHTAIEMFGVVPSTDGDEPHQRWGIYLPDVQYPYRLCRNATISYLKAWGLLAAYYGLDYSVVNTLLGELDELPEPVVVD